MASVNKVILIGNLGRDPETRYTTGGDAVTNIRIATTDTWKDKAGEKQEKTEWHSVVFFGRQAEIAGEYLKKGRQIYVEGRLQTRKWQDKEGQDRYTTEIVADRMQMLGSREGSGAAHTADEPPDRERASGAAATSAPAASAKATCIDSAPPAFALISLGRRDGIRPRCRHPERQLPYGCTFCQLPSGLKRSIVLAMIRVFQPRFFS